MVVILDLILSILRHSHFFFGLVDISKAGHTSIELGLSTVSTRISSGFEALSILSLADASEFLTISLYSFCNISVG